MKTPKDLEGKRIGVPLYTQTAAVFARGLLRDEYGVDLSRACIAGRHQQRQAVARQSSAPPPLNKVSIEQNKSGRSLSELLEAGEIQAMLGSGLPAALRTNPDVQRLFPDFTPSSSNPTNARGCSRSCTSSPCAATSMSGIRSSPRASTRRWMLPRTLALAKMRETGALRYMLPGMTAELERIDQVSRRRSWPYGVEPNRPTLEALVRYMAEQPLIKAPIPLEDLFVPIYGSESSQPSRHAGAIEL